MSNMSNPTAPSDNETSLRKQIFDYAISQADGPYKEFIPKINQTWSEYNDLYFDGSLTPAYIAITTPRVAKALADCSLWSSYGGKHQIRIRESVIDGTHSLFNPNHAIADRWLYILDVLLHEQVHQYVHEILNSYSKSYGGHGTFYTDRANQIGDALDLPPVDKRRRKDKSMPISSQWPMCVRPAGYYGDLLKEQAQSTPEEPEDEPEDEPCPDWLGEAIQAFQKLTPDQHPAFFQATGYHMPSLVTVNDDKVDRPVEPEPVETKPVVKTRKIKKKSRIPDDWLTTLEVTRVIKIRYTKFKELLDKGLFPAQDKRDDETANLYWSYEIVENWLKNNPATSR